MNVEEIKRVIRDQKKDVEYIFSNKKIIERDAPQNRLERSLNQPNVLAIVGVRRCGKSITSHMILKEKEYGYINFDDERLYGAEAKDLNTILQAFYELYGQDIEYFILDEIQNVPGWELFANRLRQTKKVILTGSNANLLSGELATHLTGRYTDFTLYPFSFNEFLRLKEIKPDIYSTKDIAGIKNALSEYIKTGGFPEAHIFGKDVVSRIFNDIIHKDIISRHEIRNKKSISDLARYLITNYTCEFSYNRLCDVVSIKDIHTIKKYIGYLESSYLILITERFSYKLKEQMKAPRKVYCIDTGIINSVALKFAQDTGKLMENLVAIELNRRKSNFNGEIYYWKDHQQREVDFVLKGEETVNKLIQVSYVSSKDEIQEREIKALHEASKELKCRDMTIITWDYEGKIDNVNCIPLWKWLLTVVSKPT